MLLSSILSTPCLLTVSQKLALGMLAQEAGPDATIVEVGPYRGGSTKILLESSGAHVHTIDMFDNIDRTLVGDTDRLSITIGGVERFKEIYDGPPIDMLFIDGDHSYFGVKNDFESLRHLLKKDAVIAFHDYNLAFIGVRMYCDALAQAGTITNVLPVDGMLVCTYPGNECDINADNLDTSIRDNVKQEMESPTTIPESEQAEQDQNRLAQVLKGIGQDWKGIGKGSQGRYFAKLMSLDHTDFIDSHEALDGGKYAIFSHYHPEISDFLRKERAVASSNIVAGKHLIAYTMYDDLVHHGGKRLAEASHDEGEKAFIKNLARQPEAFIHYLYVHSVFPRLFMRTSI